MADLTPDQLQRIRKIIADHHWAFVANTIGPEAVPQDILEDLKEQGLIAADMEWTKDAFEYGKQLAVTTDPKVSSMPLLAYRKHQKANPLPLRKGGKSAVNVVLPWGNGTSP